MIKRSFQVVFICSVVLSGLFLYRLTVPHNVPDRVKHADIILDISDKADAECIGDETAGRCSNKEPTGCPYGDSVPLGDDCNRLAQRQGNDPVVPDVVNDKLDYPASSEIFIGK